jgi:hypothetical protein
VPRYRVEALEKFLVRTTYFVEAGGPGEAERLCRDGRVAYEKHQIEEGDDEWIETLSVDEEQPLRFIGPAFDGST